MKTTGIVLFFLGIILAIFSYNLDTKISTTHGEIINDVGLMFDRQKYIIGSICIALFGIYIFLFTKK
ncbi:TPA: hypothetical protein RG647_RS15640 [Providencia rettgeri]|nr:hypothetical protein [Providencia rettgeri]